MVNGRRAVRVGERAALPNFGRCTSCVSGCVAAAAAAAKAAPALSNFNGSCESCKFQGLSSFKGAAAAPKFYHA